MTKSLKSSLNDKEIISKQEGLSSKSTNHILKSNSVIVESIIRYVWFNQSNPKLIVQLK